MSQACSGSPISPPRVIAIAKDKYLKPKVAFPDSLHLHRIPQPRYGQDITFGTGRKAPDNYSVGKSPTDLIPKMRKLLKVFAGGDSTGMAKSLMEAFLSKRSSVKYFDDKRLDAAAGRHPNIRYFCDAALGAPNRPNHVIGTTRIHQALRRAKWNIQQLIPPTDLGVPAFNNGTDWLRSGDFDNGLAMMINGVQYAFALAKAYNYDTVSGKYCITIKYVFYDVFGLDDDDLLEYGASSGSLLSPDAAIGITAWWQLQHQHGYAPLVTRTKVQRTYEVDAQ